MSRVLLLRTTYYRSVGSLVVSRKPFGRVTALTTQIPALSLNYSTTKQSPTPNPSIVEIKTAMCKSVEYHPNADSLYVLQVCASSEHETTENTVTPLLTVCSGLVKFVPKDQLEGRRIIVVTNLKPSKLRGIQSEAMLLAAVGDDKSGNKTLELVSPPANAEIGERLYFDNYEPTQQSYKSIKPKVWQGIQKFLLINDNRQVVFRDPGIGDQVLRTQEGGAADVATLNNGVVS